MIGTMAVGSGSSAVTRGEVSEGFLGEIKGTWSNFPDTYSTSHGFPIVFEGVTAVLGRVRRLLRGKN